ncbi:hypothetical protein [Streptomyces shenzhenensis]|uniref:hypothetical protein n=1 Tax=Streptomyces shenzhenensis TaxID=943815 RepID=UPI0033E3931C
MIAGPVLEVLTPQALWVVFGVIRITYAARPLALAGPAAANTNDPVHTLARTMPFDGGPAATPGAARPRSGHVCRHRRGGRAPLAPRADT